MKIKILLSIITVGILSSLAFYLYSSSETIIEEELFPPVDSLIVDEVQAEPTLLYGIQVDSFVVIEDEVRRDQSLSDILLPHNIDHKTIFRLATNTKDVFDVRKINAGKKYTLLCQNDSLNTAAKLIYESNLAEYVIFHLDDSIYAERVVRDYTFVEKIAEGTIKHSLSMTMQEIGAPISLTNEFVDVFAWQVDFFSLQKGDHFKVLYTEKQIDGQVVDIENILAIYFEHSGNPLYAFAFDQGEGLDYFDEDGKSIRKALLKYPLEFDRISSRYSLSRFHPVQKRYKAHLGTDFAARRGTPIRSVGDGIVVDARYSKNNGNFVKIRHNATYTTQYLHMSKIAGGIKAGMRVRQGQTIGFVGSTGLATGPHLCYRFWKNGVQVDALRVKLPPSEPLKEENQEEFGKVRNEFMKKLLVINEEKQPLI